MANQAPEPAPADEAAQPDHLPLAALKAKCTEAWIAHPVKIGTAPFKAAAWECFCPCEDPPDSPGGTPPDHHKHNKQLLPHVNTTSTNKRK